MSKPTEPSEDAIIRSWHIRARAYNALIGHWTIFTEMVDRLIDLIPSDFAGHALDIGGGSGLLSERLLDRHPNATITLIEPAEAMRSLARHRLGDRVEIRNATSDEVGELGIVADAALCSASFHLMNENTTLPSVAAALKPGSVFAVNLWGHSFDETATLDQTVNWTKFVDLALDENGERPLSRPKRMPPRIRSADRLRSIGAACGLHLQDKQIVESRIETRFNIEFAAMAATFLDHVASVKREHIINRALELCIGIDTVFSVDFRFIKK